MTRDLTENTTLNNPTEDDIQECDLTKDKMALQACIAKQNDLNTKKVTVAQGIEIWPGEKREGQGVRCWAILCILKTVMVLIFVSVLWEDTQTWIVGEVWLGTDKVLGYPWYWLFVLCCLKLLGLLFGVMIVLGDNGLVRPWHISRATVHWRYCSYCQLAVPPTAFHCPLCGGCVPGCYHHCPPLTTCITPVNKRWYILLMAAGITGLLIEVVSANKALHCLQADGYSYLCSDLHHVWRIPVLIGMALHTIFAPPAGIFWEPELFPREFFRVIPPLAAPASIDKVTPTFHQLCTLSHEPHSLLFHPGARATAEVGGETVWCPRPSCGTLANPYWVKGDAGDVMECNICQTAFCLPNSSRCRQLEMQDAHCVVGKAGTRPLVVVVVDTHFPPLATDIIAWSESDLPLHVEVMVCKQTTHSRPKSRCQLPFLVREGWQLVAERGGKLVVVWDRKERPHYSILEALVEATKYVVTEVIAVGIAAEPLQHPVLVSGLERTGGVLRVVDVWLDVVKHLKNPAFLPWGVRARLVLKCTPGVVLGRAWGRGVTWESVGVSLTCLEGEPLVGLDLWLKHTDLATSTCLTDPDKHQAHIQFQLTYTHTDGRSILAVYNRCFPLITHPTGCHTHDTPTPEHKQISALLATMATIHPQKINTILTQLTNAHSLDGFSMAGEPACH